MCYSFAMIWAPHVTVAAVVEQDGRYLLVEEHSTAGVVYNQPAGHVEPGESLIEAAIRETREETAWHFRPTALLGVYRWVHPMTDDTGRRGGGAGGGAGRGPARARGAGSI